MKSELRHLLQKLKSDHPDFQNIVISATGVSMAVRQHGTIRFETLDALEAYAWPRPNLKFQISNLKFPWPPPATSTPKYKWTPNSKNSSTNWKR